jgi:hypothetical protein
MGLYKLRKVNDDKESGILEKVKTDSIDYEKDFENWLENSPVVLLDDDSESTVLWIGRQVNARVGEVGKYPDLIGIDSNGDLIIVELKKGKTPREVVAQILEYASWGAALTYDDLNEITQGYCSSDKDLCGKSLLEIFRNVFLPESEEGEGDNIHFNVSQKLYIVAEEISPIVKQVAMHLRNKYKVDIYCMEYEVLKTLQGEYFISTEKILGYDEIKNNTVTSKNINVNERWNEPVKIKTVISNAVSTVTGGGNNAIFTTGDIYNELIKEYPVIKKNTVGCQIIQDCVNHTSRKHYPSGQRDLYFRIDKGKFRLYNAVTDCKWDWECKRVL